MNKNVFFLLGTSCSGKSTISRMLEEKIGAKVLHGDDKRFDYIRAASPGLHPFMTKRAVDFYDWNYQDMLDWERGIIHEQTPMILSELDELSRKHPIVIFEGMMDMELLCNEIEKSKIVYLIADPTIINEEFYNREDHKGLYNAISQTENINKDEINRRLQVRIDLVIDGFSGMNEFYDICTIRRTRETDIECIFNQVEEYFNQFKEFI